MRTTPHGQGDYRFRCEWGLTGARVLAEQASVVAVVDVLSFTTALTVAADAGIEVFPYRWRDESAAAFAKQHDAVLAVGRTHANPGEVSLSPGTIRDARDIHRLVLPSPNGSTIAHTMAESARHVIGVSLRNVDAAAAWTAALLRGGDASSVAVVPAGEQWPDGALRPAVEDLWGAGAYLASLAGHDIGEPSPEARAAIAAFREVSDDLTRKLHACASGRELDAACYDQDVDVAAELGDSNTVPVLTGPSFHPSTTPGGPLP